jgi:hypothetical protein
MSFELFKNMSKTFRPKISIRNTGHIGFSRGAINKYNLDKYKYCKLYFDSSNKIIGFQFTSEEEEDITVKLTKRGQDMFISVKPFLNYYGIDHSVTRIYLGKKDEESDLICIDLGKPEFESKRRRKKKG